MKSQNPFKKTFNLISQSETPLDGMSFLLVVIFTLPYFIFQSIVNYLKNKLFNKGFIMNTISKIEKLFDVEQTMNKETIDVLIKLPPHK